MVTGKVEYTIRHGCTRNGNPMYSAFIDGDLYRLSNDCPLVYEINNPSFRDEDHTFLLTRAGRIYSTAN